MCGRYTLRASPQQLALHFGLDAVPQLRPRYNIAPTQRVSVVRAATDGGRELVEPLLSDAAASELVISPVTTRVNSITHDDAECLTPAEQQKGLFE